MQDVLHLYETLTGKKLVMDNFVQGKVNIFISKPVPRDEAVQIVEMSLLLNGYSLIPAGGEIMKVVFAQSKNPRSVGIPIISEEGDLPDNRIVSFLFKLRYADPIELQQVLVQYLSPPQAYTSFLALPKASAILITENSSVIRTLIHIIEQVDVPPAEVVSEFIKLQRADAQKVVDMLKDVFDKGAGQPGQPGAPGAIRPVRPAVPVPQQNDNGAADVGALTALSEDSIVIGKIKLAADVRTNRIHVITRPSNLPLVRKLIAQFDENVEFAKPITRPLRYISAAEVLPVLVQALTEPGTNEQGGAPAGGAPGQPPNAVGQPPRRNNGLSNSASTSGDFGGGGSGGGGGLNVSEELSTQAVDTKPQAVTIGSAKIIVDQRSNSIIVLGNREVVVKIGKILDEMDVSSPQVALSTVIGELTLGNTEDFGVDYFERFKKLEGPQSNGARSTGGIGGIARNGGNGGATFDALRNFVPFAAAATTGGASVFLNAGFGLSAIVHALDATGRFKTISRPTVFTSNNKKAIIASGQEIPVPVNTVSSAVGGGILGGGIAQQSNIQFKKIALQLEVVPLINSEKEVSLDILQKLDSRGDDVQISGNPIPTIQTRYIKTTVTAPNCSTIVLGGLIQEDDRRNQSGIPVLSKIPVVGALFRNTRKDKNRRELIILMRPEVTLTKLDLARLRVKTEEKTHFGPELDQDDCPDCPPQADNGGKDVVLPAPDLPRGN